MCLALFLVYWICTYNFPHNIIILYTHANEVVKVFVSELRKSNSTFLDDYLLEYSYGFQHRNISVLLF